VPIRNARYALNAANARWGSLYDALYGTDVISEEDGAEKGKGGYNPVRGNQVIAFAKDFLNKTFALESGSHADATHYAVDGKKLVVTLKDGTTTSLKDASQLVGFNG
ncbi:malate synthase G, partial [Rhizobium hidalgonense]|nr:malate synthase G [Rhizobium hidalgonense]